MNEADVNFGCVDEFAELCALSTSGSLTPEEWQRLETHVARCSQCASLLVEYKKLASQGMAKLGAVRLSECDDLKPVEPQWDRAEARLRFVALLDNPVPVGTVQTMKSVESPSKVGVFGFFHFSQFPRAISFAALAAVLLFAALTAYELGLKRGAQREARLSQPDHSLETTTLRQQLEEAQAERAVLKEKLVVDTSALDTLQEKASRAERDLKQFRTLKSLLEAKAEELSALNQQQSSSLAALANERDGFQQKLRDTEGILRTVRHDLDAVQDERRKILLHSASLETQVSLLSAQLGEKEQASDRERQYLASDRDIRELMGARQLYIADVFDVDPRGKTKTPFGRVFFTKGKSLIFYAFDLDKQPGYREAKAFQAWGRPSATQSAPVSLGMFYMDSESNRRWVLKFDDPKILDGISSVFVTLEPQGGSKKPTNKPFLLAYLHTAPPNHP